ncbi:GDP/GTP exchange factor for ARF [Entomophthora muscae]|uniref:GDP/GTP exchange factor for ARF n=1 Tax=Entomophthora muscae TaxID=34485 RepID=A0ACC2RSU7_9FUNG|nr:GDP/GTP exchange factor for ARF [Entomophthora muscae]
MDTEVEASIASSYESYLEIREDGTSEVSQALSDVGEASNSMESKEALAEEKVSAVPDVVSAVAHVSEIATPGLTSPEMVGGKAPLIGNFETRQRARSEASELTSCPHWRIIIINHINCLMDKMLNNPHYQTTTSSVPEALDTFLHDAYSLTKTAEPGKPAKTKAVTLKGKGSSNQLTNEKKSATSRHEYYSSRANHFGKLGELINTQVFDFEQWDQFESIKPIQLSDSLENLTLLRQEILATNVLKELDVERLLVPFKEVLDSGKSSGPLVSASLSALQEFASLRLISPNMKNFAGAVDKISEALSNCRFLSGNSEADELALLNLIQTIYTVICSNDFLIHMTSLQVENLLRSALAVCSQSRIGKATRHQAEVTLNQMILKLFRSFKATQTELLCRLLESFIALIEPYKKQAFETQPLGLHLLHNLIVNMGSELFEVEAFIPLITGNLSQYLWILLEKNDFNIVARSLELIKVLLFTSQSHLKQQQLLWIQQVMHRLTELSTSPNSGSYKLYRDERLTFLFTDFLLGLLHSHSSFFNELYVNYDCAPNQPDLAADLLGFLVENSLRHTRMQDGRTYRPNLWMDQVIHFLLSQFHQGQCKVGDYPLTQLTGLDSLVERYRRPIVAQRPQYSSRSAADLKNAQRHKKNVREGVALFNKKASDGISFLTHCQLLPPRDSPEFHTCLSHFLQSTPGLDKRVLGDFLSKADNVPVLRAFINEFEFANKRLDVAMREFLSSFRLPGESQLISRIFELFSEKYYATGPEHLHDPDSVYLLAYSILMVNTDLHSHQVKRKIQFPSFKNMHTGSNGGKGVDEDFLRSIYDAIAKEEIVLPEEQEGVVSRDYTWKLYTRSPAFKGSYSYCYAGQYDREILLSAHSSLVDFFIQAFSDATSDQALQVTLQGLQLILQISDHHGLSDVTDYILRRARVLTGSIFGSAEDAVGPSIRNRTQQVDGAILSDLSQNLGHSYKPQLITLFLMTAAGQTPCSLFDAWWDILDILRLFADSFLLPSSIAEVPQLTLPAPSPTSLAPIPFRPLSLRPASWRLAPDAHEVVTSDSSSGILATFSSFLGYPSQYPALIWDVSPQILFSCLDSVRKLVPACQIDNVVGALSRLDSASFEAVLKRIMILVKSQHAVADEPSDVPAPSPKPTATYLPSTAFFIHWIVQSTANHAEPEQHWPLVVSFLGDVCYHADYYHPYLVQLAVTELVLILFKFLQSSQQSQALSPRCTMILDHLGSLSPAVVDMACVPLLAGFKLLHEASPFIFSQLPYWTTCLHMLQAALGQEDAAITQEIFPLAQHLAETVHFIPIGQVDYLALVNLLNEFCNPDRFIHSSKDVVAPIVNRSVLAIQYLAGLLPKVPLLASGNASPENAQMASTLDSPSQARSFYYLPPLIGLSSLFVHQRKEIRQQAFQLLKRNITAPGLLAPKDPVPKDWVPIFSRVLYPLLEKIMDPLLAANLHDTRTFSISLSSSTFLHFVTSAVSASAYHEEHYSVFSELWLQYLDILLQMVHVPGLKGVALEAAHETLKNVVLVLISTQLISLPNVTPSQKAIEHTSSCTWDKINMKLPSITSQLFPPSPKDISHPPPPSKPSEPPATNPSPAAQASPPQEPPSPEVNGGSPTNPSPEPAYGNI